MCIESQIILPKSPQWGTYLSLCYEYFKENWPQRVEGESEEMFKSSYEKKLIDRYTEGNRAFFLFYSKLHEIVGLSNVYISDDSLFIAEFYVLRSFRKQGVGTAMKNFLVEWGKSQAVSAIKIEVDKDLPQANQFWSRFFPCDSKGARNLYFSRIEKLS